MTCPVELFTSKGDHVSIQRLSLGFGCLLVAACGAPPPPAASAPGPALDLQLDPPPVHALIGHRERLQLSSEQIDELDTVGQEVHADNHPLLTQLNSMEPNGGNPLFQREVLTLASRIHVNNVQAVERVRGILTEDQRERACGLFNGSRGTVRGLRSVETPDVLSRGLHRNSSIVGVGSHRSTGSVWSWCEDEATLRTTAAR
jgi:hypothetical protein